MNSRVMPFRPMIPEIASIRVTNALSAAAFAALDVQNAALSPQDRAARAMKRTADLMDALAQDTQDLIDRCRNLTLTHEQLIERLTFRLGIENQTASMLRADVTE